MKRIALIIMCIFMALCLFGCANEKEKAPNKEIKPAAEIIDKQKLEQALTEKLPEIPQNNIEIDIKPLEEVDGETLRESALKHGFENEKLFEAFANAVGVAPSEITKEDIDKVHYIAVGPESSDMYTVYIGHVDYVDICFSDTEPDELMEKLNEVVMISEFRYDENTDTLMDLGNFENVEMFEIYDVRIDDVSFVKEYENLILGYFKNNGITDVSSLSDYNPTSLAELDFTGNSIADWSPLDHIKEKVIVFYGDADGMPVTITLANKMNQEAEKQQNYENSTLQNEDNEAETQKSPELLDEKGETVDFGSLFD